MRHYIHFTNEQEIENVTAELRCLVKAAVYAALAYEDFRRSAEISVTFTDNEGIREINREHREIDAPTDVLSFPLFDVEGETDEPPVDEIQNMLGDIVLNLERTQAQAEEFGHSFEREAAFLTVHSMLHLLGYDHETGEEDEADMRARQRAVMERMGLTVKES